MKASGTWVGSATGGAREGVRRARDGLRGARDRTWGRLGPGGRRATVLGIGALAALSAGGALGAWRHICDDCPSIAQIYAFEPKEATAVFASDGTLLHEFAIERRTAVQMSELPDYVPQAFIAIEDRRFWTHEGIDLRRTVRAGLDFLIRGYDAAGGSTITQQLAGNMFSATVNRQEISVRRKLREMKVAFSLERAYTKSEILQAYLNQINFDGVYGVQSAARRYFGEDARDLNLPEAATLAAMPARPALYSPVSHPERSVERRNLVLELMARQGMISREEAEAAMAYPLNVERGGDESVRAPYFVEWVRQILLERYGAELYEAGLRVYTTLDPELQAVADSAVRAQLQWIEERPGFDAPTYEETREWEEERLAGTEMPYLQGMFIALDPRNGDVLALIGGRDFGDSEFNRATQMVRQPGSAFKPFVYTAAIASGIPASEVFYDTPVEYVEPDGTIWSPSNFDGRFRGPITLREALYRSINVVAVKVGDRVGMETVAQYAHRMGIDTPVPRFPSSAIGAAAVRPIELVEAYTTFANLGVRVAPRFIRRIETDEGRVLWESPVDREEVLDAAVSWIMVSIMRDVVDRGTGARVRALGVPYEVPVAGKTGTTNDATNAWFVGYTPDLLTATWVGFDLPRRIRPGAQGGRDAAPVAAAVLKWYYGEEGGGHPVPEPWPRPAELTDREVDRNSGLLATAWCPAELRYTEVYLPGTEPAETCDLHSRWGTPLAGPAFGDSLPDSLRADSVPQAPVDDDFDF